MGADLVFRCAAMFEVFDFKTTSDGARICPNFYKPNGTVFVFADMLAIICFLTVGSL